MCYITEQFLQGRVSLRHLLNEEILFMQKANQKKDVILQMECLGAPPSRIIKVCHKIYKRLGQTTRIMKKVHRRGNKILYRFVFITVFKINYLSNYRGRVGIYKCRVENIINFEFFNKKMMNSTFYEFFFERSGQ